jgi:signal transduction histidine kinase
MGEAIGSKTWVATPLGAIETWPLSLRTALGLCLAFPAPACIAWGRQRVQLYNDRYSQLSVSRASGARPDVLGEDFAASWLEAWPRMRACFERAFDGEPSLLENQRVLFDRDGGRDEVLSTFSFVPIRDDVGGVGGVFITLIDPTVPALRQELARANADVDQYSYAISHDFRSPLRTLEQMARFVVADHAAQLPADASKLLDHVVRGASKLADRAEAVSQVAQIASQPLVRRRVDVRSLVDSVIAKHRAAAAGRSLEIVVGELPEVDADPELLRIVLDNLLSNACKFTRNVPHARIEVLGRRGEHRNEYSINDNGVGFDMKYAGKLYGFFQRLHADAEFEGIGAGLALARRLIERHGGTIRAEAQKGVGATFHFTLPA